MVAGVTITVTGAKEFTETLSNFAVKIPKELEKDSKQVMNILRDNLKVAAYDVRWQTILQQSIKYQKTGEGEYALTMREYGRALDEMKPHLVAWLKYPVLAQWVREHKPLSPGSGKYFGPGLIEVKPHPWIKQGLKDTRKVVKETFGNGNTIRLIRRKGR